MLKLNRREDLKPWQAQQDPSLPAAAPVSALAPPVTGPQSGGAAKPATKSGIVPTNQQRGMSPSLGPKFDL